MRKRALVAIAGTILALASMGAAFAAVPSTISIGFNHDTEFFHGVVRSSDAECQAGRVVKVYQETANGPALQGRVMTTAHGAWKIEVMHAGGHYFALAPAEKVMHTHCGRAKSRTVDVM
jgi:hypothetical protein